MSYNLSAISTNTTGLASLAQGVNEVLMFGFLGVILLIAITVITFISFQASTGDVSKSFAATAWLCMGFAMLLRFMDLLPDLALFISIVLSAGTIAISLVSKS